MGYNGEEYLHVDFYAITQLIAVERGNYVTRTPNSGIYTLVRRVEPSITLKKNDMQGKYIISPVGSCFIHPVYLK